MRQRLILGMAMVAAIFAIIVPANAQVQRWGLTGVEGFKLNGNIVKINAYSWHTPLSDTHRFEIVDNRGYTVGKAYVYQEGFYANNMLNLTIVGTWKESHATYHIIVFNNPGFVKNMHISIDLGSSTVEIGDKPVNGWAYIFHQP